MLNHNQDVTIIPDEGIVQKFDVTVGLADCYLATGRLAEAMERYERAIWLRHDRRAGYLGIAKTAEAMGNSAKANKYYKIANMMMI